MIELQIIWFILIVILLTGFSILDGFDFGVGVWHLGTKTDRDRRALLNSVGPFWDGNEVWLLTGGGAVFAAFPPVYASVFSGFYLAIMLLILALIGRAVALEFRSKEDSKKWRRAWDITFSACSIAVPLLLGVALGNVLSGIPLDNEGNFTGTFLSLLNPHALLFGLLSLGMVAFHGANFIGLKNESPLSDTANKWAFFSGFAYIVLLLTVVITTSLRSPHLLVNFEAYPILWALPALALIAIVASIIWGKQQHPLRAFLSSSVSIAVLLFTAGAALFPNMVPASNRSDLSLTIYNSSSSALTLKTMLIMALVGVPIVLGYTIWVYKQFSGKVDPDHQSNHY